jgi:hypothetical protein
MEKMIPNDGGSRTGFVQINGSNYDIKINISLYASTTIIFILHQIHLIAILTRVISRGS